MAIIIMVIIMENRVSRYYKRKKEKKSKIIKGITIIFIISLFINGLCVVDFAFRNMMCKDEMKIAAFSHDITGYNLHLFGESYIIEEEYFDGVKGKVKGYIDDSMDNLERIKKKILDN